MKVTDHGLAMLVNKGYTARVSLVEVMTNSAGAAGPTRWMAPKSILRRIYSKKNDVWAFGVLLYEGWTLVMIPIISSPTTERWRAWWWTATTRQLSGSCVYYHAAMLAGDPKGQAECA